MLAQILGIWTLLPYLLVLVIDALGFWSYLAQPMGASQTVREEQAVS